MKNLKLGPRMLVSFLSLMTLGLALLTFFSWRTINEQSLRQADDTVTNIGNFRTAEVKDLLGTPMEIVRTMSAIMLDLKKSGNVNRDEYIGLMKSVFEKYPHFIGVWTAWEPDAFDGKDAEFANKPGNDATGRFIPYVVQAGGRTIVEPLVGYDKAGDGDYYQIPKRTKAEAVIEPYEYDIDGKKEVLTTLSVPLILDGKFVGAVGIDVSLSFISEHFSRVQIYGGGKVYVLSNRSSVVAHPNPEAIGKKAGALMPRFAKFEEQISRGERFKEYAYSDAMKTDVLSDFTPVYIGASKEPWSVVVNIPRKKIFETSNAILRDILTGSALLLAFMFLAIFKVSKSITNPIGGLNGAIRKLSQGDTSIVVPGLERADELGEMAKSVEIFKENRKRQDAMEAQERERIALEHKEALRVEEITKRFEKDNSAILTQVMASAHTLEQTAQSMSATAEETNKQATVVSAAAEQTATNVQTVAAAAEELSASINEISREVNIQTDITRTATDNALSTKEAVGKLVERSRTIRDVVSLITDIAEQTNLLALNATIEAARAGDAGKGFAVVANEVKSLANQTAKATDEITSQIKEIQDATTETAGSIEAITRIIGEIDQVSSTIAAAVTEQAAATKEISGNVQQASAGIQEVTVNIVSVSKAAGDTGQASEEVLKASRLLNEKNKELEQKTSTFLKDVKK